MVPTDYIEWLVTQKEADVEKKRDELAVYVEELRRRGVERLERRARLVPHLNGNGNA
jgi:hypothetical protein